METKDYLIAIGIFTTFILGIINLIFVLKNRRNSLREHLYKEQLAFSAKLIKEFYRLNREFAGLLEKPSMENNYKEIYEEIGKVIYENEHLISDEILILANDAVALSYNFIKALANNDYNLMKKEYEKYFINYYTFITALRFHFGIENLIKENTQLYKLPLYYKSFIKKQTIGN